MAAERKSLSAIVQNGDDVILTEDLLSELGQTRRSVRQQAIKLQKETEEQEQMDFEDTNITLPSDQPAMESKEIVQESSLPKEQEKEKDESTPTAPQKKKEKDESTPIAPQKKRGRPPKPKPSLALARTDGSSERTPTRTDGSSERTQKETEKPDKHTGDSGVTDDESEETQVRNLSPKKAAKLSKEMTKGTPQSDKKLVKESAKGTTQSDKKIVKEITKGTPQPEKSVKRSKDKQSAGSSVTDSESEDASSQVRNLSPKKSAKLGKEITKGTPQSDKKLVKETAKGTPQQEKSVKRSRDKQSAASDVTDSESEDALSLVKNLSPKKAAKLGKEMTKGTPQSDKKLIKETGKGTAQSDKKLVKETAKGTPQSDKKLVKDAAKDTPHLDKSVKRSKDKDTPVKTPAKGKPGRKSNVERSRMSPLKSIPAAQREAVSGLVAKSSSSVKQKLELGNKEGDNSITEKDNKKVEKMEKRKRKRQDIDSKDEEEKDDETEKRGLRRRKVKEQESDATDSERDDKPRSSEKVEPTKTVDGEKEVKKTSESGKASEGEKVDTPLKRKRGRPRKNPLPAEKVEKIGEQSVEKCKDDNGTVQKDSGDIRKDKDLGNSEIKADAEVSASESKMEQRQPTEIQQQDDMAKEKVEEIQENIDKQSRDIEDKNEVNQDEIVEKEGVDNLSEKCDPVVDTEVEKDSTSRLDFNQDELTETPKQTSDVSKIYQIPQEQKQSVSNDSTKISPVVENIKMRDVDKDMDVSTSIESNVALTHEPNNASHETKEDNVESSHQNQDVDSTIAISSSLEPSTCNIKSTNTESNETLHSNSVKSIEVPVSSTEVPVEQSATHSAPTEPEPMDAEPSVAAPLLISGADAAANAIPSNSSPPADFPVGTAGSVTPQKAAAEDTVRKIVKKPRSRPRSSFRTHFGQKKVRRSVKRNNYDSDSTDVQSECSTEGHPAGKKYKRTNSTSTHASLESEDDRSSHSSVNKGRSNNIPALPDALSAQAEPPLCSCKMEWDKPPSSNITICNGHEVINNKIVECGKPVDGLKVLRPSTRVGFKTLCEEHRYKMTKHQCCPGCGCFCSAGIMMMCTVEEVNHHFHKECIKEIDGTLYCPHCGENASLAKEVTLPSSEALEQLKPVPQSVLLDGSLKLPRVLLARLTGMSSKALAVFMGEEEDIQTPKARMVAPLAIKGVAPFLPDDIPGDLPSKSITLKSGITISSSTLPPGPSRDALETALQFLDTDSPKRLRFFPKNLYLSTSQGDLDKVLQMLGDGFDPNYRFPSHNHETALHVAAAKGHQEIIAMLIQAGANIDPVDEDHRTPLHVATENNQILCMKYLVKHGANPQHLDDDGMSILHAAAKVGSLDAIQYILSLRKVSINVQDDGGWSPVIWAAESRNFPVVAYLLERGADPNIRDKEGNTALHWASFAGADNLTELFLSRGCDVQAVNIHGDTPLHIAARENFYSCVNMLLLRNADISLRNKENETPMDCTKPKSDIYLALQVNKRMKYAVSKRAIKTEKIISRDISRGMEVHPIPVVNAVDEEGTPDEFLYVSESCETSRLNIDRNIKHMQGCLCTDDCALETCTCARSSVQCWYSSDGHLLPEFNFHEPPMIFECGRACYCWRNCRNRVVQNGIKTHLILFRTPKMGWGVRTTQDIKQGTFICEYAGELISDADADTREDDSYLFDLDNREGDVYCIDARFYGNISRFINHLCEPNIVPVRVFIDHHDLRFPRIAFFTSRDVRANEELGFDYGDKFWAIKSKFFTCCCGSRLCKHSQPLPDLYSQTNHAGVDI